ncbi:hypothetical protein M433DRAFT_5162, partial [Acidomyces richmondensis BFW]
MRLLCVDSLDFAEFRENDRLPRYVIASHRWASDAEATFQDVEQKRNTSKRGYKKIKDFAKYVKDNIPSVKCLWIDTCCINKDSAAELSEAVNLMFKWYQNAELCLAYLEDVKTVEDKTSFQKSEWFRRGWTLQELVAPRTVVFLTEKWQVIGNKGASSSHYNGSATGPGLEKDIATVTGISEEILHKYEASVALTDAEKISWMDCRMTSREEDMSYALYGILGVTLGANYGEGQQGARRRLLASLQEREAEFVQIKNWIAPPDPWTNHNTARNQYQPQTGSWLLTCDKFQAWKRGLSKYLWLYGKSGCGKTILCSTAIEDMRAHCEAKTNDEYAIFYFSFSDNQKQTEENLIRSLVVQLGPKEPGISLLRRAHEKQDKGLSSVGYLKEILLSSIKSFDVVFLMADALDECPENDDIRHNLLRCLAELSCQAPNLRIFVTSQDVPNIRWSLEDQGYVPLPADADSVNRDINKYLSTQLSLDHRLCRLSSETKILIENTISEKADGMFRCAYCQLQELKSFKSTKPKAIEAALQALPATLDGMYERMLLKISKNDRPEALTLLRWLAYAESPLTLRELAETTIICISGEGNVEFENRGDYEDTLEILEGLVTAEEMQEEQYEHGYSMLKYLDDIGADSDCTSSSKRLHSSKKVRLAHFSVKEYLQSTRLLESSARYFHLENEREHRYPAQSCLVYMIHYSSTAKTTTLKDINKFPLLKYAAKFWYFHARLQKSKEIKHEMRLLCSDAMYDWLFIHQPDYPSNTLRYRNENIGGRLYYASTMGLNDVVYDFIIARFDVNAQGGRYGNALQAASAEGHKEIVQLLLEHNADVNVQGGYYGNALQAASVNGRKEIVQLLLEHNADVNARGYYYGNALQEASANGHKEIVQLLLEHKADVNVKGGYYGNALQEASANGYKEIVQQLLEHNAD